MNEVNNRAKEQGLDIEDVDTLVDARRIKQEILALKIKNYSQGLIKEFTDSLPPELRPWENKELMSRLEVKLAN